MAMRHRRPSLADLGAMLVVLAALTALASIARASDQPLVRAVGPIAMTVSSADRAAEFYARVLGFEQVADSEVLGEAYERLQGVFGLRLRVVRMRLGDEEIALHEYLTPRGRPIPADSRSHDRWFQHVAIIVSDMDRAYARLREHRVEHASPAPQRLPDWNPAAGGIRAFYFKDPDGHPLEILWFPPGKGDPKWRRATDRLFLGIDHTAIVVADTEASLRCYRDVLGLRVTGESDNHGPEQERLNNVFGAHLRITALRAPAGGPGIELLEYRTPRDGRPVPADARANDLAHWQTGLVTGDAAALHRTLRGGACAALSPEVAATPDRELGFARGLLIRDPDGHVLGGIEP
jgi:catechol 2,3-dioxygenase-like lactoylglutathione lyase family enzyme